MSLDAFQGGSERYSTKARGLIVVSLLVAGHRYNRYKFYTRHELSVALNFILISSLKMGFLGLVCKRGLFFSKLTYSYIS